ncbi:hypothetical protein [Borrelia persica]|uniref:hypothetical protein n=1 Tax=Borrelia persica TaxID=44448 RepID=UPI001F3D1273|nr:hypothetical protein [Borrelia persica]
MSMLILFISLLLVCCGQDRFDSPKSGHKKLDIDSKSVRSVSAITPSGKMGTGSAEPAADVLSNDPERVVEKLDTRPKRKPESPKRAYSKFKRSYERLKRFYNRRPQNFNVSLFNSINKKFGVEEKQGFKDSVYESLNGDIVALDNLKKIVMITKRSEDAYRTELNARPLLIQLCGIVGSSIFAVMNETGTVLSKDNLVKLQNSQDVVGLNNLKNKMDDMYEKWEKMVNLLQDIINNGARFATQDDVIKNLQSIVDLDTVKHDQDSHDTLCLLKNELVNLQYQIEEQVRELRLGLVKSTF